MGEGCYFCHPLWVPVSGLPDDGLLADYDSANGPFPFRLIFD
jgi:hypothetical protein